MKKALVLSVAIAVLAVGCWEDDKGAQNDLVSRPNQATTKTALKADIRAGQVTASACRDCHGDAGVSETRYVPHLAGQRPEYLVSELKAYRDGDRDNAAMHAVMKRLSDQEMQNMAAYFAQQGAGKEDRSVTSATTSAAITVDASVGKWVQKCDRCHNGDSYAESKQFPILAGQREEYLVGAIRAYQNKFQRDNSMMHAMTDLLSVQDIKDIAKFYANRPGRERVGAARKN